VLWGEIFGLEILFLRRLSSKVWCEGGLKARIKKTIKYLLKVCVDDMCFQ
jgi:hypothetical protein